MTQGVLAGCRSPNAVAPMRRVRARMMRVMGVRRTGFTLLDVMITVTIIAILASVVIPLLGQHIEKASAAAADSSFAMVRKTLDLYYQRYGAWPATIDKTLFVNSEEVTMPDGYQLQYNPTSGALNLLTPDSGGEKGGDAVVLVEP